MVDTRNGLDWLTVVVVKDGCGSGKVSTGSYMTRCTDWSLEGIGVASLLPLIQHQVVGLQWADMTPPHGDDIDFEMGCAPDTSLGFLMLRII